MTWRWVEWLFQREALTAAKAAPVLPAPAREQLTLAWAMSRLADSVATSSDPLHDLGRRLNRSRSAELAIRLYRDACRLALSQAGEPETPFAELLSRVPRETLLASAGSEAALEVLENSLLNSDARRITELQPAARSHALELSTAFVHALLRPLVAAADPVARVRRKRRARWAASLAALGVVGALAHFATRTPNYAEAAAWTSSSGIDGTPTHGVGFTQLAMAPVFFHTDLESDPWIEFDLGRQRTLSAITVDNRTDCCGERSASLEAAVSLDHTHYTALGKCLGTFLTCSLRFAQTPARYVKLHVPTKTYLHLEHVELR